MLDVVIHAQSITGRFCPPPPTCSNLFTWGNGRLAFDWKHCFYWSFYGSFQERVPRLTGASPLGRVPSIEKGWILYCSNSPTFQWQFWTLTFKLNTSKSLPLSSKVYDQSRVSVPELRFEDECVHDYDFYD